MLLQLGNFMNFASSRGGAVGMRLATLEKLGALKASSTDATVLATSGRTLLHFLARVADAEAPEALHARDALPHLGGACAIDQEGIERELKEFKRALGQFKHEIQAATAEANGTGSSGGGGGGGAGGRKQSSQAVALTGTGGTTARRKKPKPPKPPKPPAVGGSAVSSSSSADGSGSGSGSGGGRPQHPYTLFFESLTREVARLEVLQAEVSVELEALYASIGERREAMPPQELLKTIDGFLVSLGKAHAELLQAGRDRQRQVSLCRGAAAL